MHAGNVLQPVAATAASPGSPTAIGNDYPPICPPWRRGTRWQFPLRCKESPKSTTCQVRLFPNCPRSVHACHHSCLNLPLCGGDHLPPSPAPDNRPCRPVLNLLDCAGGGESSRPSCLSIPRAMPNTTPEQIAAFIERWEKSGGAERSNYVLCGDGFMNGSGNVRG